VGTEPAEMFHVKQAVRFRRVAPSRGQPVGTDRLGRDGAPVCFAAPLERQRLARTFHVKHTPKRGFSDHQEPF
jgi:hypothetical protein